MSRELIVEPTFFGARAGLLEAGRLLEFDVVDNQTKGVQGRLYWGRVRTVDQDLDAAFVDCGLDQDAYLTARDARWLGTAGRNAGIGRHLSEGQAVLVQGKRDPEADKGARVTADIALPGMYLDHHPRRSDIELSPPLERSTEAEAQKARATALFPSGGIRLRRAARRASDQDLRAEADQLHRAWHGIEEQAGNASPPVCLDPLVDPVHRLLQRHADPDLDRILLPDRMVLAQARSYLAEWRPSLVGRLDCVAKPFETLGVGEQLDQALAQMVPLPGGGRIIIETTHALTAIDVDGGGGRALEANLEAADEIARQLRLRQIGGIVVVDFVNLPTKRDRAKLRAALERAIIDDPAPVQIFPMTPSGLVEINRLRTGPRLAERVSRACPVCDGAGRIAALQRCSQNLMADLAQTTRARARVAPDLHAFLTQQAAADWQAFAARRGIMTALEVDIGLGPGKYRIDE